MTSPPDARRGNLLALGLGQGVRLGAGVVVNVLMMRMLGVEGFGVFGYVSTLVALWAFVSHLGLPRLLIRDVAREPASMGRALAAAWTATAGASVLAMAGLAGWVALVDGRPLVVGATVLAGVALALRSLEEVPGALFQAVRRMAPPTWAGVAGRLVLVATTALFLWLRPDVLSVFAAQVTDGLVALALVTWQYRRSLGPLVFRTTRAEVTGLTRRSLPFGLNFFFGAVYMGVDIILLEHMRGDADVGVYRAAALLVNLLPVVAVTFTTGIYPRLARMAGDREGTAAELVFASRVLLAASMPVAVGGMLLAEPLLVFLGGAEYAPSALPFVIMAPILPLRFLNNGFGTALSALDRQELRTRGVFWAAIFNFATNLVAIPLWGVPGAAATTLLTELLLTAWMGWWVRPLVTGLGLGPLLLRTGLPALLMGAVLLLLPPMHVVPVVALGAAVYALGGWLSGAWHPRDVRALGMI